MLCVGLGLQINAANAQSYIWQTLSPNDAIQAVQVFEGDSSLGVTVMPPSYQGFSSLVSITQTPVPNSIPSTDIGYDLNAGRYDYRICAFSRDIFFKDDHWFIYNKPLFYGQPYDPNVLAPLAMSQSAAKTIAQAYMTAHYPHPELLTQMSVRPKFAGVKFKSTDADFIEAYRFAFYQQSSNGVEGPGNCVIDVDTVKGQVVHCYACSFPLLINPVPSLTSDQATASAMNILNVVQGVPAPSTGMDVGWPDALGNETVVYYVKFSGIPLPPGQTDPTGYYAQNYVATVDAFTGNVIYSSSLMSIGDGVGKNPRSSFNALRARMKSVNRSSPQEIKCLWDGKEVKLNHPAYMISGKPYLYAGALCYGLSDARLNAQGNHQYSVTSAKRRIDFTPDSDNYVFNGKHYRLIAKPVLLKGQCYVPLEMVRQIMPNLVAHDVTANELRFQPQRDQQASQSFSHLALAGLLLASSLLTVGFVSSRHFDPPQKKMVRR